MSAAEQLMKDIVMQRNQLALLEKQLQEIQLQCAHDFLEEQTHRTCQKCNFVESYHY